MKPPPEKFMPVNMQKKDLLHHADYEAETTEKQ